MRVTDKIALIEKIGLELQSRFSFSDIDAFLAGFSVARPIGATMNSKRLYAKLALAGVSNDVILSMASELGLEIPDVPHQSSNSKFQQGTSRMSNDIVRLLQIRDFARENFTDGDWHEVGLLTECDDIVNSHPRLLRSLSWGDPDYPETILPVLIGIHRRDPNNLAILESFVSRRGSTSGINVSSGKSDGKTIIFKPKVFDVPSEDYDPKLVSVMMPFHVGMKPVYSAIQGASAEAGFKCERADDIWQASVVIQDVFSLIYRSFIVICDFTGKNPNVFYEAGIAHTLGKHVIPITQSDSDIPFDLRHHRHLTYHGNDQGIAIMRKAIVQRLQTLDSQR